MISRWSDFQEDHISAKAGQKPRRDLFVQIASGDIDRDRKAAKVKVSTLFQDPACFFPYVFIHLVDQSLFFNQGDELVWRDKSWNKHRFFRGPEVEEDRSQNMQRLLRAELGKNAVLPA